MRLLARLQLNVIPRCFSHVWAAHVSVIARRTFTGSRPRTAACKLSTVKVRQTPFSVRWAPFT